MRGEYPRAQLVLPIRLKLVALKLQYEGSKEEHVELSTVDHKPGLNAWVLEALLYLTDLVLSTNRLLFKVSKHLPFPVSKYIRSNHPKSQS